MKSWRAASPANRRSFAAISIVFASHPKLLEFLFEKTRPRLSRDPLEMRRLADEFSPGEQILIRVALDMWSGSGNAKVWQLLENLDSGDFYNVLKALAFLRGRFPAN